MASAKHGSKATRRTSRPAIAKRKAGRGRAPPGRTAQRRQLEEMIQSLRLAMSVVVVSIGALRQQDAENDAEVARVLARHVADRLDAAIEKAEELLAVIDR